MSTGLVDVAVQRLVRGEGAVLEDVQLLNRDS